jgi:hypothetical protein
LITFSLFILKFLDLFHPLDHQVFFFSFAFLQLLAFGIVWVLRKLHHYLHLNLFALFIFNLKFIFIRFALLFSIFLLHLIPFFPALFINSLNALANSLTFFSSDLIIINEFIFKVPFKLKFKSRFDY